MKKEEITSKNTKVEKLVQLTEYMLDRNMITDYSNKEYKIQETDIETEVQQILKDNHIEYKTKIDENWSGGYRTPKYELLFKVYVYEKDYELAKKLISTSISNTENEELISEISEKEEREQMKEDIKKLQSIKHRYALFILSIPIVVLLIVVIYYQCF